MSSLVLEANKYDKYIQEGNLNSFIVRFQESRLDERAQQWRYAYELEWHQYAKWNSEWNPGENPYNRCITEDKERLQQQIPNIQRGLDDLRKLAEGFSTRNANSIQHVEAAEIIRERVTILMFCH